MKRKVIAIITVVLLLSGCNFKISKNNSVYNNELDGRKISIYLMTNKEGEHFLGTKVNNDFVGFRYEKGGFLSKDEKYFYYFDDMSKYDIYENGELVEPIESINRGSSEVLIYKLDAEKDNVAYPKGTVDFEGIYKTYVLVPKDENELNWIEVNFDGNKLFDLVSKGEKFIPEYREIAMESVDIQPHRVCIQYSKTLFDKEYIQFFDNIEEYTLGIAEPTDGILQVVNTRSSTIEEGRYYYLTDQQKKEFDEITKYNETVK